MNDSRLVIRHLSADPLFGLLSEQTIAALASDDRCVTLTFSCGQSVNADDAFRRALGLVLKGQVDVHRMGGGSRVLLNRLEEGRLFGCATLFADEEQYLTAITAKTKAEIFFIPSPVCEELIAANPAFALAYIRFLSDRIRFLNRRLASLSAPCVEEKLAKFFSECDDSITPNMAQLASALGIGRASLYRMVEAFVKRGFLQKNGKTITVVDRAGLAALQ